MLAALFVTACSNDKNDEPDDKVFGDEIHSIIYKINGDYSNNVSILYVNNEVCGFPGTNNALFHKGIKLKNGFVVGGWSVVGNLTAFTKWTYEEYAAMPKEPSIEEFQKNIIKDARITEAYEMPFYITLCEPDLLEERCNELIEAGLPGCKLIYKYEE